MAELALAIIPLGITVTSSLTKYLKAFNGHDDDRARLVRQAERFESTFQSLEAALKRSELDPGLSASASEAHASLKECQKALTELETLQQKVFATTTSVASSTSHARTREKIKGGCKKLIYPLKKPDIEILDGALNRLSTTLDLTLGILHLDGESLTRKTLNEQIIEIQKNTVITSVTSTAIKELRQPISKIDLALPVLQTSVDSVIPHVNQRFDQISYQIAYQHAQMQAQIKSLLDTAELTRYQDRTGTSQKRLQDHSEGQGNHLSTGENDRKLTVFAKRDLVSMCSCPSRRMRQDKRFALGSIHFAEEMLSDHCHEKDCVFFLMPSGYERTRTIRFTGFASVFKRGLEVSFTTRARAGKFSISPSFTYFPVVDEKVAPGFLVMSLLRRASRLEDMNETRSRIILSAVQRKLQELFCSGRASPNDVTQKNYTLLHLLIDSLGFWLKTLQGANSSFVRLTFEGLLDFLVASGTSVTVRSRFGEAAVHKFILGTFVPASLYRHLNAGDEAAASRYTYYPLLDRRGLLDYHDLNQSVARIHYGPLGLAIIQNNLREVERIISLHPNMLEELSYYGETPLHIAIYRLDILKVLAKKVKPEDWIRRTLDDATVLHLAIQVSREICSSGDVLDESCCPCTLPLRVILTAGCPIIPHRDFNQTHHTVNTEGCFSEASLHCKTLVAKELRSRRRQLKDLAKNSLSITELSNFTALEEVLDRDAIEMDRLLREKGVVGLGPLSTFVDLSRQPWQDVDNYSRSIFFDLKTPEDATLFVDYDFQILFADEDLGSPLDRALLYPNDRYISLEYAMWLFEHQAPLWKWSYRFTSPMPSIFVLADILGIHACECPCQDITKDRVEHYLAESTSIDNCSCLCSPDGCTPFTSRMKWLAHPREEPQDHTPQDIVTKLGYYVKAYGNRLDINHHIIMVRQATFAALDLKHTCLDRPGYGPWPGDPDQIYWLDPVTELEPDEIEFEILNVDVEARNQLENVVAMFQDFVLTGDQATVSAKVDSCGIDHSVSNDPSVVCITDLYYQRVLEFWQHIWPNRIQDALEAVAKGWDNKLDGRNDLVQISTCEESIQEAGYCSEEEDDGVIFNKIVQQIQDI
ncbi:uncharacterized protein FMAN_13264 [Fusarium mangiferae]|uniref:Fungal N-terminal domain-containing protein n=1 Tax=Fusarium mangiferae TaxID=192010 RepID=A0A1L7TAS6_FUSMA|nr:uncharacterized protein FMAN_13264 [Fusarium mangiferae]CVK95019.1 uncharacterized protein FMAN_13264 [Fusarium mangiferae]